MLSTATRHPIGWSLAPASQPSHTIISLPFRCKPLYYVSETDLLKGMHAALLGEVIRANDFIEGQDFTNLYNFVSLLADHFPTMTFSTNSAPPTRRALHPALDDPADAFGFTGNELRRRNRRSTASAMLRRSDRAKKVFGHLKSVLDQRAGASISSSEWRQHFENAERIYAHPFPVNATWQQCRGSSPEFRGFTCSLWTTFHTLTVHTYMATIKSRELVVIGTQGKGCLFQPDP